MIFPPPICFQDDPIALFCANAEFDDMLEQLKKQIQDRAFFLDATLNAEFTQRLANVLDQYGNGTIDLATARTQLKQLLVQLDYAPGPGMEETLQDLGSDTRLNLILETNADMAAGYAQFSAGQSSQPVLDVFPAYEFRRAYPRKKPRDLGPLPWVTRWQMAGGDLVDGRMIARKDDQVWQNLGSSALFPDGLDNPYPPFAFNSGMDVFDVRRDEAEKLGVIDPGESVDRQPLPDFNEGLSASGPSDEALRSVLEDQGYTVKEDGTVSL